jgi:hypothetical protein
MTNFFDFYWIYDLPNWQLGVGVISFYLTLSVVGLFLTRDWIYRTLWTSFETNEATNGIISAYGVLYGLLLGLVTVAAWENFDDCDEIVSKESAAVVSLYRDVSALKPPLKEEMQNVLKEYLVDVIDVSWPAQRDGIIKSDGAHILSKLHAVLGDYEPKGLADQSLYEESLTAFNRLSEARRLRVESVSVGIPAVFWVIIVMGAVLHLPLIYLLHTPKLSSHLFVTVIYSTFMGSIIFLLAAVDNPFRGDVSISSDSFKHVLNHLEELDPAETFHKSLKRH